MANRSLEEEKARTERAIARRQRMLEPAPVETPESRIELLCELTRAAWVMTGSPWVRTPRSEWPGRVRNLGEPA